MGPHHSITTQDAVHDRALAAAREAFPEWEITEILGGFAAVPRGAIGVYATSLDGLVRKLREQP